MFAEPRHLTSVTPWRLPNLGKAVGVCRNVFWEAGKPAGIYRFSSYYTYSCVLSGGPPVSVGFGWLLWGTLLQSAAPRNPPNLSKSFFYHYLFVLFVQICKISVRRTLFFSRLRRDELMSRQANKSHKSFQILQFLSLYIGLRVIDGVASAVGAWFITFHLSWREPLRRVHCRGVGRDCLFPWWFGTWWIAVLLPAENYAFSR